MGPIPALFQSGRWAEWKPDHTVHDVLVKRVLLCRVLPPSVLTRYRWGEAERATFEMLSP